MNEISKKMSIDSISTDYFTMVDPREVVESDKEIGEIRKHEIFGKVYKGLIEILISEGSVEEKTKRVESLVENVPQEIREKILSDYHKFSEQRSKNERILSGHRGQEKEFLLRQIYKSNTPHRKSYNRLMYQSSGFRYEEPTPGMPIIIIDNKAKEEIPIKTISFQAVAFSTRSEHRPSFVVISDSHLSTDPNSPNSEEKIKLHETHHVYWMFADKIKKKDERKEKKRVWGVAFENFKNEAIAYELQNYYHSPFPPENYVYVKNKKVRDYTVKFRKFLDTTHFIANYLGTAHEAFLSAEYESESFADLKEKALSLIPKSVKKDKIIEALVNADKFLPNASKGALQEVVVAAGIRVDKDELENIARKEMRRLLTEDKGRSHHIRYYLKDIKTLEYVFGFTVNANLATEVFAEFTGRSEFLADLLLKADSCATVSVNLTGNMREDVERWLSCWNIDNGGFFEAIREVLKNFPEASKIWSEYRHEIIEHNLEDFRKVMTPEGGDMSVIVKEMYDKKKHLLESL